MRNNFLNISKCIKSEGFKKTRRKFKKNVEIITVVELWLYFNHDLMKI